MARTAPRHTRKATSYGVALLMVVGGLAAALAGPAATAGPPADPVDPPTFGRIDVDTALAGAAFTVVGEVFPGEQNIVTAGYGPLVGGNPAGGGTVQVYRPIDGLTQWDKVAVVEQGDDIVFPNQVTIHDIDGDGDNDLIVPGGYFFDTNPLLSGGPKSRGTLTWWENQGLDGSGVPRSFVRHDVITDQPWSYHSAIVADLDDDGTDDLLSTGEQGRSAPDQTDDEISMQFFRGLGDGAFAAPVEIATVGGSIPVVHDVDGDGLLDIVSSQYFDIGSGADADAATFLWLEQVDDGTPGLAAGDFLPHTIATRLATDNGRGIGPGFQIRPVPDFRGDGQVAWVGTNHTNRCTLTSLPPEEVVELVPGPDPREPWALTTLSNPSVSTPDCPVDYTNTTPIFPGEDITSRIGYGQAAPGVFGYGDVDGDGDIDLLVSGDGDRRLFWIEQRGDGSTLLHTLTAPGEEFGQSGGAVVADLNDDGVSELVFSSFDKDTVAIWQRGTPEAPYLRPVTLTVTPAATKVRPGSSQRIPVVLIGADVGAERQVTVTHTAARTGVSNAVGTVTLTRESAGRYVGTTSVRSAETGTVRVHYAGAMFTAVTGEQARTAAATVRVTTKVKGFGKRLTTRKAMVALRATVTPGAKRKVVVQQQVCKGKKCGWKKRKSVTTKANGKVAVKVKVKVGTTKWRLKVPANKAGLATTSGVKKVIRR